MQSRMTTAILALAWIACGLLSAVSVVAEGSGPPPTPTPSSSSSLPEAKSPEEQAIANRRQAEDTYGSGWREVEKAKREVAEAESLSRATDRKTVENAKKRSDSATKRLRKAVSRFEQATQLSPEYHEAWNMLGYCLRKLGEQEKAFEAYWKCLSIKPDYAPAREYLGEAYLLAGNLPKARAEFAWLKERSAPQAEALGKSIAKYEEAHPQPQLAQPEVAQPEVASSPADSTK